MVPWIKGKEGLDRRMSFCAGAKICSAKRKHRKKRSVFASSALEKKRGEDCILTIDDVTVKVDGKEITISAELISNFAGARRNRIYG